MTETTAVTRYLFSHLSLPAFSAGSGRPGVQGPASLVVSGGQWWLSSGDRDASGSGCARPSLPTFLQG